MSDMTPTNSTWGVVRTRMCAFATKSTYEVSQRNSPSHEPEEHDQARHAEDQHPCSESERAHVS